MLLYRYRLYIDRYIGQISLRHRFVDVVSTSELHAIGIDRHRVIYRPYIRILIARPKAGLFRLHASWIYLSYAGFDCLAAILCH